MQLHEQHRPRTWSEVVGQARVIAKIEALRKRGLPGRAYWISGQSGTGNRLEADVVAGSVSEIVVWRLDRLGRTAAGLTALFEELQRRGIRFEALRDKVDLSTAAGRLMANVLASVAA